ncbi:EAL domain-containing protein [Massilia niastensis]|uniref:EAL domain-containing protein n=1 Tax=Massilia niastensis TaxID=544911 RepID=UPI00039FC896|nr:EAL domain-containing protein [Massilia niastensis]
MISGTLLSLVAFGYLLLLFGLAYYGDKAGASGRSIIANPYVYSLSLTVYLSAGSFYGSVGRAADSGIGFLPVYLGPSIMAALWWLVLRKIIRIAKDNHITSLADFISSRYGKSGLLAGLVAAIAVIGMMGFISLQLKAMSTSYNILLSYPDIQAVLRAGPAPVWSDSAFYMALILAAFTIVYGTRQLDASERHEGMVAAVAFEALVKLAAFLAVGMFVTFGMYDGFGDIFARAEALPKAKAAFTIGGDGTSLVRAWSGLFSLAFIVAVGSFFLPRLFQVAVVENVDESHLNKAVWLFPLYLLLFTIFMLPIALGGLLHFAGQPVNPDTFVLTLPLAQGQTALALLVFLGGVSAGTGMVVVESIALSTMVCNDIVMPVLLRIQRLKLAERADLSRLLLGIRRVLIVAGLLMAYAFFRLAWSSYALLSIGLISLVAVSQFAPAVLGGIYWKGATRTGALAGISAGFLVWVYTQMLPAFARSGWLPMGLLEQGPFGIELLRPLQLFGLSGLDELSHGMLWSMLVNAGAFIGVSVLTGQTAIEKVQAALFVDVFRQHNLDAPEQGWRAKGSLSDLEAMLSRFLGQHRAAAMLTDYARQRGGEWPEKVDAGLVTVAESQLAGVLGAASARAMIASVIEKEPLRDSLTGMPNRAWMCDYLDEVLQEMEVKDGCGGFALLLLSLDRFRVITDSLGGAVGDRLLVNVAKRLNDSLRPGDAAARIGGEEFAILLKGPGDAGEAQRFAERLQADMDSGFRLEDHEVYTTASIGIVPCTAPYGDAQDMLRDAETANHRAVARGGASIEVFDPRLRDRALALFDMETMLRQAVIKGDSFEVFYQPIVTLATGQLAGFEALVRLRRTDGTLVPPAEFIPLTEETGLIVPIGHLVLAEACRQMHVWKCMFPQHPFLQVSVNLAGRQFMQPRLVQEIEQVLSETGLDAASLKLEVTETLIMEHAEEAAAALFKLRDKGIKILIDDFGTGYSSLAYLRRFPLDTLKIDASFVRKMDTSREDMGIVQTIVTLAHTLALDTIAEGVETERQMAQLRELKVAYGQGYYFARPLDSRAAEALIAEWPQWPRAMAPADETS